MLFSCLWTLGFSEMQFSILCSYKTDGFFSNELGISNMCPQSCCCIFFFPNRDVILVCLCGVCVCVCVRVCIHMSVFLKTQGLHHLRMSWYNELAKPNLIYLVITESCFLPRVVLRLGQRNNRRRNKQRWEGIPADLGEILEVARVKEKWDVLPLGSWDAGL